MTALRRGPELIGRVERTLRCPHPLRSECINIDDFLHLLVHAVRHGSRYFARKAVRHQYEVVEVVVLDHIQDILDGGLHAHIFRGEVDPVAHSSQSDWIGRMTLFLQEWSHVLPGPRPQPCAWDEHESCHEDLRRQSLHKSLLERELWPGGLRETDVRLKSNRINFSCRLTLYSQGITYLGVDARIAKALRT